MKRIRILFFYGDSKKPCIKIECWEFELESVLDNQDRDIYRVKIEDVSN